MSTSEKETAAVEYFPSADAWVEEGGKVHLMGSHCPKCGKYAFPAASFCDKCGNTEGFEPAKLSDTGKLYSFSEIQVAPKGLGFTAPYTIGYVDLPEDVRLFGQVEHPAAELECDEPVKVVLGTIRTKDDGRPVISYKFRKVGGKGDA